MNRLHALAATLVAALALLVTAGSAVAGTYTVSQCDARTGATLPGWTTLVKGQWKAANDCPKNLRLSGTGSGRYAAFRTPRLPAELGISRVSFLASGLRAQNARPEAGFCKTTPATKLCKRQLTRRAAKGSRKAHSNEYVWHQHGNNPGANAFEVALRGTGPAATSSAFLNARHFKFTIADKAPPTLGVDASSVPTSWASGTFKVKVTGQDAGGGIAGFWLTATGASDSSATRHITTNCDYNSWQPCPAAPSATFTINTADFDAGTATLSFTAEDAGGNRSAPKSVSFTVDNTPPPTPGPVTYTAGGCSPAALSWAYPTTSDSGSPFVAVKISYALWNWSYPADVQISEMTSGPAWILPIGSTSDETGLVSIDGIESLRLPTVHPNENYYAATIQIVDAAGNASPPSLFYVNSDPCPS